MNNSTKQIQQYLERLFPITRSITGEGNRETLKILQEIVPLQVLEYPSNTPVYDWVIPKEWNIRDAYIKNSAGKKLIDFKNSNFLYTVLPTVFLIQIKNHIFQLFSFKT